MASMITSNMKSFRTLVSNTCMLQIQRTLLILQHKRHDRSGTWDKIFSHCRPIIVLSNIRFYCNHTSPVSILDLDEHRDIKTALASLKNPEILDTLVGAVLDRNIEVSRVALQNNIVVHKVPGSLTGLAKKSLPKSLTEEITLGKFSPGEDEIIGENWNKLLTITNISEETARKYVFDVLKIDESVGKKQNVLGYYLAQGLSKPRLATEVFHRAKQQRCGNAFREFTPEDDKVLLEFVQTHGEKWNKLARLLNRTSHSIVSQRYNILVEGQKRKGAYTIEESLVVLEGMIAANNKILDNRIVTKETCKKIGEKLQRNERSVFNHWRRVLEPTLMMHEAGSLGKDFREDILNHLLEQGVNYNQEVNWEELTKLPQFAGTTTTYLQMKYQSMVRGAVLKYPGTSKADRTTEWVKTWWLSRDESSAGGQKTKELKENEKYVIVEHFQKLCMKNKTSSIK